ncbi:MAG: Re/Si-specific NAD(P)(+) transhydrogenase subunit alpha [Planctomycetota bacterium]|nr:MAG: Re/Si-specific NAD(P)(+) transhydrogenase subunit alpha [Planctomycetota bacterium]
MRVGIPKETATGETRVAAVPDSITKLGRIWRTGLEVVIERGAGAASGFLDEQYEAKGAMLVDRSEALAAPLVLAVNPPDPAELAEGTTLVCMADPLREPARIQALAERRLTCFSLELLPRISRAQSMDVLSSMANVAGYKAVLLAAARAPKLFPLMMTAAGTVRPAKVFVLGVGVAGLQAIATAKRLGAMVEAYDLRPETKEQVESLGARFIEFDLGVEQEAGAVYAKELTEDQKQLQASLMAKVIQAADIVITTAQVPGRRAPMLIPADVVAGMKPGSVIVDMAADSGGNCALSEPGREVIEHGVIVIGPANLPASVANTTSQLYANNLVAYLGALVKEGEIAIDLEDEVVREPMVCRGGEVTNERVKEALK